jgi:ankyrin repeat protein
VDINHRSESDKYTALWWTVHCRNIPLFEALIAKSADVGIPTRDTFGKVSPLETALKRNYPRVVKLLLEAGVDLNVKDQDGNWKFHFALNS